MVCPQKACNSLKKFHLLLKRKHLFPWTNQCQNLDKCTILSVQQRLSVWWLEPMPKQTGPGFNPRLGFPCWGCMFSLCFCGHKSSSFLPQSKNMCGSSGVSKLGEHKCLSDWQPVFPPLDSWGGLQLPCSSELENGWIGLFWWGVSS